MISDIKPTVLVIAGAGTKGIYGYLGPLYVLKKTNWLDQCHTFAGTSIGSFFAACLCLNYDIKDLVSFAWNLNYFKYASKISVSSFIQKGFATDTLIVKEWLQILIEKKIGKKDLTLQELYNYSGKTFMCNSILKSEKPIHEIYTFKSHPNLYLSDVVQNSCNLPLLFKSEFVDGGVINNFLIDQFDHQKERILGLRFKKVFPIISELIPSENFEYTENNTTNSNKSNNNQLGNQLGKNNNNTIYQSEITINQNLYENDENLTFSEVLASMNHPGLSTMNIFKNLLWVFMIQNQELEKLKYKNIKYECIQLEPLNLTTFSIFVSKHDKISMFYNSLYTTILYIRKKILNYKPQPNC